MCLLPSKNIKSTICLKLIHAWTHYQCQMKAYVIQITINCNRVYDFLDELQNFHTLYVHKKIIFSSINFNKHITTHTIFKLYHKSNIINIISKYNLYALKKNHTIFSPVVKKKEKIMKII